MQRSDLNVDTLRSIFTTLKHEMTLETRYPCVSVMVNLRQFDKEEVEADADNEDEIINLKVEDNPVDDEYDGKAHHVGFVSFKLSDTFDDFLDTISKAAADIEQKDLLTLGSNIILVYSNGLFEEMSLLFVDQDDHDQQSLLKTLGKFGYMFDVFDSGRGLHAISRRIMAKENMINALNVMKREVRFKDSTVDVQFLNISLMNKCAFIRINHNKIKRPTKFLFTTDRFVDVPFKLKKPLTEDEICF